jgi:hypothetical protein
MTENYEAAKTVGTLAAVGLLVGLGQLLASPEKLTARIVVGRALSSAGIGAASAAVLAVIPGLPFAAQLGIAAAMASLGTSAVEQLFQRILGK